MTNPSSDVALVTVRGAIDVDTAPRLRGALEDLLDAGASRIVVDLGGVEFCDSIGLGTLAYTHSTCVAAGGYLRLAAPRPFMQRLLTTVGLTPPIPVHRTVESAVTP
ncbi:STAS domain-containing protein [Dactylosporangium sp. AC04546]|uniref:STAS domain-containing protein n=1 Tax=Dactylosporangium sp. AC04546 TaxID=2862460 RepID=UPI001EE13627|nr:STAS domain-containing protein [Dactylosporangium sp. AC04546]WVK89393.1 STAS domain-containing protein [Dactylosporangium sp. AC04546]